MFLVINCLFILIFQIFELQTIFSKVEKIAEDYNLPDLLIQSIIIQAQLDVISGNLIKAINSLDQARNIAEKLNFPLLVQKVSTEKHNLTNQLDKWDTLIQDNAPLKPRLDKARLEEYFSLASKTIKTRHPFFDS